MTVSTNRRQVVFGAAATIAAAASPAVLLEPTGVSPEFQRLARVLVVRLFEHYRARDALAHAKPGLAAHLRTMSRGSFHWYQSEPVVTAADDAFKAARVAAEDMFMMKALTADDQNLRLAAIGLYEGELGDTLRFARKHFAPETLS